MDSTLVALYFESTGSMGTGSDHSSSGQTSQMLPATSTGDMRASASGAITLPMIVTAGLMTDPIHVTGAITLPVMTSAGRTGGLARIRFPAMLSAGTGTIPVLLRGAITLPMIVTDGSATISSRTTGAITLPHITTAGRTGWLPSTTTLPAITSAGTGWTATAASGAATLPGLRTAGTATWTVGIVATGHIILPAITSGSVAGAGAVVLPRLIGSGAITNGTAAVYQGWTLNVKHVAITSYENYAFRAMARAFDQYWSIGYVAGLFRLGGDDDNGTAIPWEWETGLSDLGSPAQKGLLAAYIDGVVEKDILVHVVTDSGTYKYKHVAHGDGTNHKPQRCPLGKGVRTRNVGLGMSSTKGRYMMVSAMTPEYVISNRNL